MARPRWPGAWLREYEPLLKVFSTGRSIDLYKDTGTPVQVAERYRFAGFRGSHLVCHTGMATESAVTPDCAHPFTAGEDFCLVHNGSLSNPNGIRRMLAPHGIGFDTDNDTEAATRFLEWRLREGDSLRQALQQGFDVLDGFYTFLMGTPDELALIRDPFACKPPVVVKPTTTSPSRPSSARSPTCRPSSMPMSSNLPPRRCTYGKRDLRPRGHSAARGQPVPAQGSRAVQSVVIENPNGAHAIAAGVTEAVDVVIDGNAGYYAAGMNQHASVTIHVSAGTGLAENMMSGKVHVRGFSSNAAGATAQGGLLVIDGDAGLRCGISLKGADIVVGGSVGSFSAFMAQAGNLVVLGDAGASTSRSAPHARTTTWHWR